MKLHLISDLHLEIAPYRLPDNLDCDVVVAAGDIGVGTAGIEWLKTLGKPVVYVLGNHEYWSKRESPVDMALVLDNIKSCAAGSNVHVLENEFVIIDGVRFFGATFWTNLGQFNTTLIDEARHMNDNVRIYCQSLYEDEVFLSRFVHCAKRYCALKEIEEDQFLRHLHEQYIKPGRFHPFVGYLLNEKSWRLIQNEILLPPVDAAAAYDDTVVVTHHHPSYQSLRFDGVPEHDIYPCRGDLYQLVHGGMLYKTAAYASDLKLVTNLDYGSKVPKISAWLCGHLHTKMDYAHDGARIVCNPRGYAGDGIDFDSRLIIDPADGVKPCLQRCIEIQMPTLQQLLEQIQELAAGVDGATGVARSALLESIDTRAADFGRRIDDLAKMISDNTNDRPHLFLSVLLDDPNLDAKNEPADIIEKQKKAIQRLKDWQQKNRV